MANQGTSKQHSKTSLTTSVNNFSLFFNFKNSTQQKHLRMQNPQLLSEVEEHEVSLGVQDTLVTFKGCQEFSSSEPYFAMFHYSPVSHTKGAQIYLDVVDPSRFRLS